MEIRELRTVTDCIDAIGRERVQRVTKRRSNNLTNWKAAHRFPPYTYLLLQHELSRVNCRARAALWGIAEPRAARQRAA